jgi:DNA modification methylase
MYSGKSADVGNSPDAGLDFVASQFGLHMRFFCLQAFRVMKPGTIFACHIQQLLTYKIQHGFMGRRDFRGAVVDIFSAAGFDWQSEFIIQKNPQAMAQRQKLHSLLFVTGKRDARGLAPCPNDYVMIFRKPGQAAEVPAIYDRDTNPDGWLTTNEWIRDAHGVWTDIQETDVLDGYKSARQEDDERHVCPLQLEVIRRIIRLYSNPGEVVLDPFGGIGSVSCVALEQDRNSVMFELKESYFEQAKANVALWQERKNTNLPTLFDMGEFGGFPKNAKGQFVETAT